MTPKIASTGSPPPPKKKNVKKVCTTCPKMTQKPGNLPKIGLYPV